MDQLTEPISGREGAAWLLAGLVVDGIDYDGSDGSVVVGVVSRSARQPVR